jgi:hypothetical protein
MVTARGYTWSNGFSPQFRIIRPRNLLLAFPVIVYHEETNLFLKVIH